MLKGYINYPNKKMSGHFTSSCNQIGKHLKTNQRYYQITLENLSNELLKFRDKKYKFEPNNQFNDMWVEIELDDPIFEEAVFRYIGKLLADHSKRFKATTIEIHCRTGI